MYSISSDRPLASVTLSILRVVDRVAKTHGVDYFVIGATARDILLTHVFGMPSGRATRDVDFALAIPALRFAHGARPCSTPLRFEIDSPFRWPAQAAGSTAPWLVRNRPSRISSAVCGWPASCLSNVCTTL